ncbi:MAG: hypothetical protein LBB22_02120 [Treponema sp.]|nr:hypothetical protein [Treponema sp.]
MNKFTIFTIVLFFIGIVSIYCDPIENDNANIDQNTNTPKTFYMPIFSYTFISLDDIQVHNAIGGLSLYRLNPNERDKLFSISVIYTPQILTNAPLDFPNLYHTAALSSAQKINRHTINAAFIATTDKPLYGGLRTFMGMAGYSYDLVKGVHFSMDIGVRLIVMDIGLTLDNGGSWLLWPTPAISLSWKYEWIRFGLIPGAWMTIAPKSPVSLNLKAGSPKYDVFLLYRYFKNENPLTEIIGLGIGIKRDSSNVMRSDGWKYSISYDTIYGSFRIFRLFEISGGWIFNSQEGYETIAWETLFESNVYSDDSMYGGNAGNGFFVSISVRMNI